MRLQLFFVLLLVAPSLLAQDKNQVEAIKEFKDGTYPRWKRGTYSNKLSKDGEYTVAKEYDENGNVKVVKIGSGVYEVSSVKDYYNKIYTGTHFQKDDILLVYMDDRLYTFTASSDGGIYKIHSVIGKKGGSYDKAKDKLEKYLDYIQEVETERKPELEDLKRKSNPEVFYAKVYDPSEGYKKVKGHNDKYGFLNSDHEEVVPTEYDDSYNYVNNGIVGVKKGDYQGYIDMNNKEVIPINHDWVLSIRLDLIAAGKDGEVLFYDLNGKVKYKGYDKAYFDDALNKYCVKKDGDFGLMSADGKVEWLMKDTDYDNVYFAGTDYIVVKNGKQGIYSPSKKKLLVSCILDNVYAEHDGMRSIKYDGKYGYFKAGEGFVTEIIYDQAYDFSNGVGQVHFNGEEGSADISGKIKWNSGRTSKGVKLSKPLASWRSKYDEVGVLYGGMLTSVSKNGKFGFVDENGVVVIPLTYDQTSTRFEDGLAQVKKNGYYGYINESGTAIVPVEYDKVYSPSGGQIKVKSGKSYYYYDLNGNKLDIVKNVASKKDKLISFYRVDSDGYVNDPYFDKYHKPVVFGFEMPNGKLIYGGNEDGAYVRAWDEEYFGGIYWKNNFEIPDGTAVSETEFVIPYYNEWHMYKIVNGTFEKVKEYEYSEDGLRCLRVELANDNWVIGLWRKEKNLYLGAWNTKSGETISTKITHELYDYRDDFDQVKLSVDVSKSMAVATYQITKGGSSYTKDVKNMVATFDLNQMVNSKSLKIKWSDELKSQASYEIQDAVIDSDGNVFVLLNYSSNKNYLVVGKYNSEGELLTSVVWENLNPQLWSRSGAQSVNPEKYDVFYFDIEQPYFLEINKETDQVYVVGKLNDMKFHFSYSGVEGKSSTMTPFVIGLDESTLEITNYDFFDAYKKGSINNAELYDVDYGKVGELKLENTLLVAHENSTSLYMFENMRSYYEDGFIWEGIFGAGSSSRVTSSTVEVAQSTSSSSTSSSSSSSSGSSSSETEVKKVQVQVNPNGKGKNFVHIHWTENGSSKKKTLQAKSTGVVGNIPEGTKLYYTADSDSKKIFFYEVPSGKSNVSVKID